MTGFVHKLNRGWRGAVGLMLLVTFWSTATVLADGVMFTNQLAHGDMAGKRGQVTVAIKFYDEAARSAAGNAVELCVVTRRYCDLMYDTTAPAVQKQLAQTALACAQAAVKADGRNAIAHLCVAVCYAKNFPYIDHATKVAWSKEIKKEGETAIVLDPKQDLSYYLLGRWNYDTANIGFLTRSLVKLVYGGLPPASNEEAIQYYKQAIALAPNRILHRVALAQVYETVGQPKLAAVELEKCRTLKPVDRDDAEAQKEAAAMLAKLKF